LMMERSFTLVSLLIADQRMVTNGEKSIARPLFTTAR